MIAREPSDEIIDAWRKGLKVLSDSQSEDSLVRTAGSLLGLLNEVDANKKVRDEFNELFLAPVGDTICLEGSRYIDGKTQGKYLVRIRTFLEKTPFVKEDDYKGPEDTLDFHLDLMRCFIKEEQSTECVEGKKQWRALQKELVTDFMALWVKEPLDKLKMRDDKPFYSQAANLMNIYIDAEQDLLIEKG
jgi:TorA maturation chaperone TorD